MKVWLRDVPGKRMGGPASFTGALSAWLQARGDSVTGDRRDRGIDVALAVGTIESPELRAFKWRGVPIVQRIDGVPFSTPASDFLHQTARLRRCYEVADAVVFQSRFSQCVVERSFGAAGCASRIIYNGVDLDRFTPRAESDAAGGRPFTVACASVWRPHKRLGATVRGFFAFHKRWPQSRLLVIGPVDRVPRDVVEHPAVSYLDALDHVAMSAALQEADVFMHLAWLDWCPNVVLEAQAAGLPVICADGGGTREILLPDTGVVLATDPVEPPTVLTNIYDPVVIPPVAPEAVADALAALADGLPQQRRRLMEQRDRLGIERAGSKYLDVFEGLTSGRIERPRQRRFFALALRSLYARALGNVCLEVLP